VIGSVNIYNTRKRNGEVCNLPELSLYATSHVHKGPGRRTRKADSYMQWRYWLGVVNRTCRLQDSGVSCQKQWVDYGHLSNVKVNGVFFSLVCTLSRLCDPAGLRRSKGKRETKIRGGAGQRTIAMSSFASGCPCTVKSVSANHLILKRIASLDLDDDCGIDWKSLSDPSWNMWTGHHLRQKWRWLKACYKADHVTCHRGQYMTILLQFSTSFFIGVVHHLITQVSATR
jgi:hypothetical protein